MMGKTEPRIFTPPLRDLTPDTSLGFACIAYATDELALHMIHWLDGFAAGFGIQP